MVYCLKSLVCVSLILLTVGCADPNYQPLDNTRARHIGRYHSYSSPNLYLWEVDGKEYLITEKGGIIKHTRGAEKE